MMDFLIKKVYSPVIKTILCFVRGKYMYFITFGRMLMTWRVHPSAK